MSMFAEEISADTSWPVEATRRMNRMYRRQRHIYDGTRRYYLLGRDRLIANLAADAGANVLEIGCGTGRNLVHAARLYPDARFFGIDVSTEMLTSAISAISRRDLSDAYSRRAWRRNGLQSAGSVRHRPVRPRDDFLQPVDDPGLAPCAAGGRKPPQARRKPAHCRFRRSGASARNGPDAAAAVACAVRRHAARRSRARAVGDGQNLRRRSEVRTPVPRLCAICRTDPSTGAEDARERLAGIAGGGTARDRLGVRPEIFRRPHPVLADRRDRWWRSCSVSD